VSNEFNFLNAFLLFSFLASLRISSRRSFYASKKVIQLLLLYIFSSFIKTLPGHSLSLRSIPACNKFVLCKDSLSTRTTTTNSNSNSNTMLSSSASRSLLRAPTARSFLASAKSSVPLAKPRRVGVGVGARAATSLLSHRGFAASASASATPPQPCGVPSNNGNANTLSRRLPEPALLPATLTLSDGTTFPCKSFGGE